MGVRLTGAIAAYNEEHRVASAVRSLLGQHLPPGVQWEACLVAASGCTDQTVEVVRAMARADPRIQLLEEPKRSGKSAALGQMFARARGDFVVLLNADALAEPGSVAALLRAVPPAVRPVAVMGRCEPPGGARTLTDRMVGLLWGIHNRFYGGRIASGNGEHVSEELLLLSAGGLPALPVGTINDGAFIARWVRDAGGTLGYAPDAVVRVEVPARFSHHVRQRRRIIAGHRQITAWSARPSATVLDRGLHEPGPTLRLLWQEARRISGGLSALGALVAGETIAQLTDLPARLAHRTEPAAWAPVQSVRVPEPLAGDP